MFGPEESSDDMTSKKRRRHAPDQSSASRPRGMKASGAKRLKELEAEQARLKKWVANTALDIDMLKKISAGNF